MKKVFSLLLILLPLTLLTVSCHDEEEPVTATSPYAKYKGPWSGTYAGSDLGTIEFSVNANGSVSGDVESEGFKNAELTLKGKVDIHGNITMTFIETTENDVVEEIGSFVGTMNQSNASGTWVNDKSNIKGSWVAMK